MVRAQPIGALGLSFAEPQAFAEADRTFLLTLAQVCANNLARTRLDEELTSGAASRAHGP
jgi:GAF domain-containing protein